MGKKIPYKVNIVLMTEITKMSQNRCLDIRLNAVEQQSEKGDGSVIIIKLLSSAV